MYFSPFSFSAERVATLKLKDRYSEPERGE
jgi:hypothetical protein